MNPIQVIVKIDISETREAMSVTDESSQLGESISALSYEMFVDPFGYVSVHHWIPLRVEEGGKSQRDCQHRVCYSKEVAHDLQTPPVWSLDKMADSNAQRRCVRFVILLFLTDLSYHHLCSSLKILLTVQFPEDHFKIDFDVT